MLFDLILGLGKIFHVSFLFVLIKILGWQPAVFPHQIHPFLSNLSLSLLSHQISIHLHFIIHPFLLFSPIRLSLLPFLHFDLLLLLLLKRVRLDHQLLKIRGTVPFAHWVGK